MEEEGVHEEGHEHEEVLSEGGHSPAHSEGGAPAAVKEEQWEQERG